MSTCPAAFEVLTKPAAGGAEEISYSEPDQTVRPARSRAKRWAGRVFRTVGVLVVLAMAGFLTCQHLLPTPMLAVETAARAAVPAVPPAEDDRKVAVCFGYAD